MKKSLDKNHRGFERTEKQEVKAERKIGGGIESDGLGQMGLGFAFEGRRGKVKIARRLRNETGVTLQWVADCLQMGTWGYVASLI